MLEVIDTHTHYLEAPTLERPWDASGVHIETPLSAERLLADAAEAGVSKIVQLTATVMGYDNRYALECAVRYRDRVAGVFGRFDPLAPNLAERLHEFRNQPGMLGVRLALVTPEMLAWIAGGTLESFFAEVERQRIPFAITAPHRPRELGAAARRYPGMRWLIDHMTLGLTDRAPFAQWQEILALAGVPNVWLKVSYLHELAGEPYPFPSMQPYLKELVGCFGAERLVWGSNYPNSLRACTYRQARDFIAEACDFLSDDEKRQILGRSFLRFVTG